MTKKSRKAWVSCQEEMLFMFGCNCSNGQGKHSIFSESSSDSDSDSEEEKNDFVQVDLLRPDLNSTRGFPSNTVHTAKYNLASGLPLSLLYQFHKVSNCYFLLVMIVTLVPGASPINPFSSIAPLCFVLGAGIAKDLWEDSKRRKADQLTNEQIVHVLRAEKFVPVKSLDVVPGDVMLFKLGEEVKADCLILGTSLPDGLTYIETANLDGETNAKTRRAKYQTSELLGTVEDINDMALTGVCRLSSVAAAAANDYNSNNNSPHGGSPAREHADAHSSAEARQDDPADRSGARHGGEAGGSAVDLSGLQQQQQQQTGSAAAMSKASAGKGSARMPAPLGAVEHSVRNGGSDAQSTGGEAAVPYYHVHSATAGGDVGAEHMGSTLPPAPPTHARSHTTGEYDEDGCRSDRGTGMHHGYGSSSSAAYHARTKTLDERMEAEGEMPVPPEMAAMSRSYEANAHVSAGHSGPGTPRLSSRGQSARNSPQPQALTVEDHHSAGAGLGTANGTSANALLTDSSGVVILGSMPSPDLSLWYGQVRMVLTGEVVPVGIDQFLPRGCIIRNTDWVLGAVVYTGKHTKMLLNLRAKPNKTTLMTRRLNQLNVFLFILNQVIMFLLCGLAIWYKHRMRKLLPGCRSAWSHWYMQWNLQRYSDGKLFWWRYLTNFVLLSYLIPMSLYVTLEFNKAMQMLMIGADKRMAVYDEFSGKLKKARPKTSELNCQLGQVEYIFTDKTGTLTENLMTYVGGYAAGVRHDECARPGGLGSLFLRRLVTGVAYTAAFDDEAQAEVDGAAGDEGKMKAGNGAPPVALTSEEEVLPQQQQQQQNDSHHHHHPRSSSNVVFTNVVRQLNSDDAGNGGSPGRSHGPTVSFNIEAPSVQMPGSVGAAESTGAASPLHPRGGLGGSGSAGLLSQGRHSRVPSLIHANEQGWEDDELFRYLRAMSLCHSVVCFDMDATTAEEQDAAAAATDDDGGGGKSHKKPRHKRKGKSARRHRGEKGKGDGLHTAAHAGHGESSLRATSEEREEPRGNELMTSARLRRLQSYHVGLDADADVDDGRPMDIVSLGHASSRGIYVPNAVPSGAADGTAFLSATEEVEHRSGRHAHQQQQQQNKKSEKKKSHKHKHHHHHHHHHAHPSALAAAAAAAPAEGEANAPLDAHGSMATPVGSPTAPRDSADRWGPGGGGGMAGSTHGTLSGSVPVDYTTHSRSASTGRRLHGRTGSASWYYNRFNVNTNHLRSTTAHSNGTGVGAIASLEDWIDRSKIYEGQSLDEIALVSAARENGFALYQRTGKQMFVKVVDRIMCYDIVAELEFTPQRKLMSILLQRNPSGDSEAAALAAAAGKGNAHYHRTKDEEEKDGGSQEAGSSSGSATPETRSAPASDSNSDSTPNRAGLTRRRTTATAKGTGRRSASDYPRKRLASTTDNARRRGRSADINTRALGNSDDSDAYIPGGSHQPLGSSRRKPYEPFTSGSTPPAGTSTSLAGQAQTLSTDGDYEDDEDDRIDPVAATETFADSTASPNQRSSIVAASPGPNSSRAGAAPTPCVNERQRTQAYQSPAAITPAAPLSPVAVHDEPIASTSAGSPTVKAPYLLLVKGADSSMMDILNTHNPRNAELRPVFLEELRQTASKGLRTLVLGQRYLTESEVRKWLPVYNDAQCAMTQRSERMHEAYAMLERDVDLVGSTAVEDRLQDGVPETLKFMSDAGIVVWMLTGDKRETAVTIARTSGLVDKEFEECMCHLDIADLLAEEATMAAEDAAPKAGSGDVGGDGSSRAPDAVTMASSAHGSSSSLPVTEHTAPDTHRAGLHRGDSTDVPSTIAKQEEVNPSHRHARAGPLGEDDDDDAVDVEIRKTSGDTSSNSGHGDLAKENKAFSATEAVKKDKSKSSHKHHKHDHVVNTHTPLYAQKLQALESQLDAAERMCTETSADSNGTKVVVVVVDGKTLEFIFTDNGLAHRFFLLGSRCRSAVCCRMTPLQKAQIVHMFQKNMNAVALAVGDGANDVSMIQEAKIGVGIMGLEGSQAELASDYAIPKFRFLKRLMMVHGRFSIFRDAHCILYSLYKNVVLTVGMIAYTFYSGYSGQAFIDSWLLAMFSIFFCSLQPLMIGILDKDVEDELAESIPQLYPPLSRENMYFSFPYIAKWLIDGLMEGSAFFFFLIYTAAQKDDLYRAKSGGIEDYGETFFTMMVLVVDLRVGVLVTYYMVLFFVAVFLEIVLLPVIEIIYSSIHNLAGSNWCVYTAFELYGNGKFYMFLFMAVGVFVVYNVATSLYIQMFYPWQNSGFATFAARRSPYRRLHRMEKQQLKAEYMRRVQAFIDARRQQEQEQEQEAAERQNSSQVDSLANLHRRPDGAAPPISPRSAHTHAQQAARGGSVSDYTPPSEREDPSSFYAPRMHHSGVVRDGEEGGGLPPPRASPAMPRRGEATAAGRDSDERSFEMDSRHDPSRRRLPARRLTVDTETHSPDADRRRTKSGRFQRMMVSSSSSSPSHSASPAPLSTHREPTAEAF